MKKFRIALFGCIVSWLFAAFVYIFRLGGERVHIVFADVAFIIVALAAVSALCYLLGSLKLQDSTAKKWVFLTVGAFLFLLGEVSLMIYEVVLGVDAFPSVADVFWLAAYIPFFIGLVLAIRETGVSLLSSRTPFLFLVIGGIIAFFLVFLMQPILESTKISMFEKFLDLAYPLLDLVLIVSIFTILILYEKGLLGKPWLFILAGIVFFAIADLQFSYFTWIGVYELFPYRLIDLLWLAGGLAIALGAMYKKAILEMATAEREIKIPRSGIQANYRV
jgi:hypothetical protein